MNQKQEENLKMVRKYPALFYGVAVLFGLLFVLSFYRTQPGLMFSVAGTVTAGICILVFRKFGHKIKKLTILSLVGMVLLAWNVSVTSSYFFIFFDICGILILLYTVFLFQFMEIEEWRLGKYIMWCLVLTGDFLISLSLPFRNLSGLLQIKNSDKKKKVLEVLAGICISVPLLLVILSLLSTADTVFGSLLRNNFLLLWKNPAWIQVGIMFLLGFFFCYCGICGACRLSGTVEQKTEKNPFSALTASTFCGIILLVYLVFCAIQFTFLFTGGMFRLPAGVTYSSYAREGFFQLLCVTLLNLVLVIVSSGMFQKSKVLKGILTGICGCTYIMIISAFYRILLYVSQYNLTFLRILVIWFLILNLFMITGALIAVYREHFPLFYYLFFLVMIFYLLFGMVRPDRLIAKYNINYTGELDSEEINYLTGLSYDAAPELKKLAEHPQRLKDSDKEYTQKLLNIYLNDYRSEQERRGIRGLHLSFLAEL